MSNSEVIVRPDAARAVAAPRTYDEISSPALEEAMSRAEVGLLVIIDAEGRAEVLNDA